MIVEAILNFFLGLLTAALELLPTWDPIDTASVANIVRTTGAPLFALLSWGDHYLPATLAVSLLVGQFAVMIGLQIWNAAIWVLTKLHVLGGSS